MSSTVVYTILTKRFGTKLKKFHSRIVNQKIQLIILCIYEEFVYVKFKFPLTDNDLNDFSSFANSHHRKRLHRWSLAEEDKAFYRNMKSATAPMKNTNQQLKTYTILDDVYKGLLRIFMKRLKSLPLYEI